MTSIVLDGVTVEFPLYHATARSMKRYALGGALGRKVHLDSRRPTVTALEDIDLTVREGDRLAVIGANGSGKTTLLRTAAGIYPPAKGRVTRVGTATPLLGMGTGANLAATGLENIFLFGMHLDIPPAKLRGALDEIIAWSELGPFIGAPLRSYSSGMVIRLAFAVSTAFAPDILIMDEWMGLADADFQMKSYERMSAFVSASRIIILASHQRELLRTWCNRAIYLDGGRLAGEGAVDQLLGQAGITAG